MLAFSIADLTFPSYQAHIAELITSARRLIEEASMDCIKLERGREVVAAMETIISAGISVMADIAYPRQSRRESQEDVYEGELSAGRMFLKNAKAFQEVCCFVALLESVPDPVAKLIIERFSMITIGVDSGPYCHGQAAVTHDMLGLSTRPTPEFVKQYTNLAP